MLFTQLKKLDYHTKFKNITTNEFNKLTKEDFAERLTQGKLATEDCVKGTFFD